LSNLSNKKFIENVRFNGLIFIPKSMAPMEPPVTTKKRTEQFEEMSSEVSSSFA
jgi:hypothetical protein